MIGELRVDIGLCAICPLMDRGTVFEGRLITPYDGGRYPSSAKHVSGRRRSLTLWIPSRKMEKILYPIKKRLLVGSFKNLGTLKARNLSHSRQNGPLRWITYTEAGRSLRPGTRFGVCSRLSANHIHWIIYLVSIRDFTLFGRFHRETVGTPAREFRDIFDACRP